MSYIFRLYKIKLNAFKQTVAVCSRSSMSRSCPFIQLIKIYSMSHIVQPFDSLHWDLLQVSRTVTTTAAPKETVT